jgi:hypothetical protein
MMPYLWGTQLTNMDKKKIYFATKALIIKNNKYLALHKT